MSSTRSRISRATWAGMAAAGAVTAGLTGYLATSAAAHAQDTAPTAITQQATTPATEDVADDTPSSSGDLGAATSQRSQSNTNGFQPSDPVAQAPSSLSGPVAHTRGS